MNRYVLGLDIGSNSVGSAWIDRETGRIATGVSIFPAGVEESDEKRGDPKNAKRRMTRRTRITLARRAKRKRELRLKLINAGLLPSDVAEFGTLLENTDPWALRRKGLDERLSPHEFGRVILHLAQRRGALGLRVTDVEENENEDAKAKDDGKVKKAIGEVQAKLRQSRARTFGELIAMIRDERVTAITTEDRRRENRRKGPREYREAVRNKAGSYEHCADRQMIRDEFAKLWDKQVKLGGETATLLTDDLRRKLDDESGDSTWRHKGLLFGQRRASWDLGTLGRCVLEPTERCAPHADMYASRFLVVETVNNLKIKERGKPERPLTPDERQKIKAYLSGPLGMEKPRRKKGETKAPNECPKRNVTVTDLRNLMDWKKTSPLRFNIENDEDRQINTDWFSREIIHGAVTPEKWVSMREAVREGLNRAILKYDPDQENDAVKLKKGVMDWAGLSEMQADALAAAWRGRPKLDSKRLNMSRRAVRNLLRVMDRDEPWPDLKSPGQTRWLTQIEARKLIADDNKFKDVTTGKPIDDHARRRYATGAKGATARDRHYVRKHALLRNGKLIVGPDGAPLSQPPPAPLIGNPVARKAIHEVRRHLIEYMTTFGCKPDEVYVELYREARMGKKDADRLLFRNRLRNRIKNDIIEHFNLHANTTSQQRAAVDRVVLCVQQGQICALCGNQAVPTAITPRMAAEGEGCEVAHIIPKASGGRNGLGNIVLAHTKCNRDMARRTPRQFWSDGKGFDEGIRWVEAMYGDVPRPKSSEIKSATDGALWACYFRKRDDDAKIEQFKKDIKDIKEMTARQEAATKYAARQVMAYLSDALYDGKGLPERGGERRIYATDGMWTGRLRREWGLFFDRHQFKAKGISSADEQERKEKDRGDHRHHAIDAVVTALGSRTIQIDWENREVQADKEGINTADEEAMGDYRRRNLLEPPPPYKDRDHLYNGVRLAVFGDGEVERPICHRPVKRKLIGALHEETLFGPVLNIAGNLTDHFTASKSVSELKPTNLRMPRPETESEAVERLSRRYTESRKTSQRAAKKKARALIASKSYTPKIVDPPTEKTGLVRDLGLRKRLRDAIASFEYEEKDRAGNVKRSFKLDPDNFTPAQIKAAVMAGAIRHRSGVPIRSVILLRTISDPVIVDRKRPEHADGQVVPDDSPASKRAYVGGNNHHIEIRFDKKGKWSGKIVPAFEVAQRKLAKLKAFRKACIPRPYLFRKLARAERAKLAPTLRDIEKAFPLVDRNDDDSKGGNFVMSLCEGEMLLMRHKSTGEVGYFVVAKLDKPQSIVLVPHWDARSATGRKDAEGRKVPNSKRDQFSVTPSDLKSLAPQGQPHAVKVSVSPLGKVTVLERD